MTFSFAANDALAEMTCMEVVRVTCIDVFEENNFETRECTNSETPECRDVPNCCDPDFVSECPNSCLFGTMTPTATATPTDTPLTDPTATNTPQVTVTGEPTATFTYTATAQSTDTATPLPTNTATSVATNTPTKTYTPQPTNTATPQPSHTPTIAPTNTPTATFTPQNTSTSTPRPTVTPRYTDTSTPLPSMTPTTAATETPRGTSTVLPTSTATTTPRQTGTAYATPTTIPSASATATISVTPDQTALPTGTSTATATPVVSATATIDANTPTPSGTPTPEATHSPGAGNGQLTIAAECIQSNSDGTFTSYFSYNNVGDKNLRIEHNPALGNLNTFYGDQITTSPPENFEPGLQRGVTLVQHRSQSVTWSVKDNESINISATSGPTTAQCANITPQVECVGTNEVLLGYSNPNPFTLVVDLGPDNFISTATTITTGPESTPPEVFLPGRITSAMKLRINNPEIAHNWTLQQQTLNLSESLRTCTASAAECLNVNSTDTIGNLDKVALELSAIAQRTAYNVQRIQRNALKKRHRSSELVSQSAKRSVILRRRAVKRAKQLEEEAYRLTILLPKVSKTCLDAPSQCATIDRLQTITSLRRLYAYLLNITKRQTARYFFVGLGETKRNQALVVKAKKLVKFGNTELDKLPRFATDCS